MIEHTLPLRIQSESNVREHWRKKAARAKSHRFAAIVLPVLPLPVVVTLTRIAPRPFDDDNLRTGFKALRDGIADRFGVKDNDPRIEWKYGQARGRPKEYAARIRIEPKGIPNDR